MRDALKMGMHYKEDVCVPLREYGITVSTRVNVQGVSDQVDVKQGIGEILRHDLHSVSSYLTTTFGPNRGLRAYVR